MAPRKFPQRRQPKVSVATKKYVTRKLNTVRDVSEVVNAIAATAMAFDATGEAMLPLTLGASVTANDKPEILSLRAQYRLVNPASAGTVYCRLILFQWYDNSDVAPAKDDILNNAQDTAADVTSVLLQNFIDNSVKVKILSDRYVKLGEATSVEGNEQKVIKYNITQKMLGRKFIKSSAASEGFNHIYLMGISTVADASSPPTIIGQALTRVRYEA